jgi:hypothetical protein
MRNAGASKLEGVKISVAGPDAKDFVESNSCGASLDPKKACSIIVTFVPLAKGDRRATISVSDSGGGSSPQEIPLTGTGT